MQQINAVDNSCGQTKQVVQYNDITETEGHEQPGTVPHTIGNSQNTLENIVMGLIIQSIKSFINQNLNGTRF